MNLTLITKLFLFVVLSTSIISAQTVNVFQQSIPDTLSNINEQKIFALNLGAYKPLTTETSFIGQGTRGRFGFDIGAQVFVYKSVFVGAFVGYFFLDVTDTNLVGDYKRSRAFSLALDLGYEHSLTNKIDIGASIAPLAFTSYRNYIAEGRVRQQRDEASSTIYRAYISYRFAKHLALFVNYSFRADRSSIETATEIQSNFNKIQYHNIGFGLRAFVFKN